VRRLAIIIVGLALALPASASACGERWAGPTEASITPGLASHSALVSWQLTRTHYEGYASGGNEANVYWQIIKLWREGAQPGEYAAEVRKEAFVQPGFYTQTIGPLASGNYQALVTVYYADTSRECSTEQPWTVMTEYMTLSSLPAAKIKR
jgi:hypothetical protein